MTEPTPPPVITKELLRELGDWRVDKEGRHLAEAGRVQDLNYTGAVLSGTVGNVKARLKLAGSAIGIENQCSCRQARVDGIICAHVVALVYAYLNPRPVVPVQKVNEIPTPTTPAPAAPTAPLRVTVDGTLGGLAVKVMGGTRA